MNKIILDVHDTIINVLEGIAQCYQLNQIAILLMLIHIIGYVPGLQIVVGQQFVQISLNQFVVKS